MKYRIIHDECLHAMQQMEDNSIDFIVTDPPYGLHFMGKHWDGCIPAIEIWADALKVCKPGAMLAAFGGSRTHHHLMLAIEGAGWEIRDVIMWIYGSGFPKSHNFGKKRTSEMWHGYGTALKPAYEPIIIAMKPLDGTFAENAKKWGVAGINIEKSRIPGIKPDTIRGAGGQHGRYSNLEGQGIIKDDGKGRWPANLIFDEEAAAELDQMTQNNASRFFYCAKSSSAERNRGLEGMPLKQSSGCYGEFEGDGRGRQTEHSPKQNIHPTVKPITLMKYIITLLAPPGNPTLLDPFCGSGSTLVAAKELGISAIGIEKEYEYVEVAQKRLDAAKCIKQMEMFNGLD